MLEELNFQFEKKKLHKQLGAVPENGRGFRSASNHTKMVVWTQTHCHWYPNKYCKKLVLFGALINALY